MASREDQTISSIQKRPRSRKSIAHAPSPDTFSEDVDKENATADLGALKGSTKKTAKAKSKSRSKSIGPGGLDGLKEGAGNRRALALASVKSILKPTVPLSPLRAIPSRDAAQRMADEAQRLSYENESNFGPQAGNELIDISPPSDSADQAHTSISGANNLPNPFGGAELAPSNDKTVSLKTEEEQQVATRKREERERQELVNTVKERRDARRKSLANRRVSFAPEATLHTWDVVEYFQDSTTSSDSTNSTRRNSSISEFSNASTAAHPPSPIQSSDPLEPPSTPPEQVEETAQTASPAHQRDLHQKKRRRRSSGIPPMNFNNPDDIEGLSSSPYSGSSVAEGDEDSGPGSSSESDGGSTVMSIDEGDQTVASMASNHSACSSTGSSGRLEEALRQAAKEAGTKGIDYDEHGDMTMEMVDDEVTMAFQPWVKKSRQEQNEPLEVVPLQNQENQNPFSPAFRAGTAEAKPRKDTVQEEDMSMEITHAIGGILPSERSFDENQILNMEDRGRSATAERRQSNASRRRSSGGAFLGDETMDFTLAIGGIQIETSPQDEESNLDDAEELTMEFTSVFGGLLASRGQQLGDGSHPSNNDGNTSEPQLSTSEKNRESMGSIMENDAMEITTVVDGILAGSPNDRDHLPSPHFAQLSKPCTSPNRSQAKLLMEQELDVGTLANSPLQDDQHNSAYPPGSSKAVEEVTTLASETGSPIPTRSRTRGAPRRSDAKRLSATPRSSKRQSLSPVKNPGTPSKQVTPQAVRPSVPGKTPPSKNITFRSASPKRLFKSEIKKASSTPESIKHTSLFQQDANTGLATPMVVFTPQNRRSSGLGLDKGLGSPRVAALLDRRRSIGEDATSFTPQGSSWKRVRMEDPKAMERELEREREEDTRRESGRVILEKEADMPSVEEKDATVNLKEMIESLTPKKKVNGRKSLHVGAARGLLGKRPIELDEDEEDLFEKRFKGREGSPVKTIKLPAPPQRVGTTGRATRNTSNTLAGEHTNAETPTTGISPLKYEVVTTPRSQGRFKDVEDKSSNPPQHQSVLDPKPISQPTEDEAEDIRIHLQDFLNLTSIRFMDLTTTKRRHTVAPNAVHGDVFEDGRCTDAHMRDPVARDLERCVVAGACTIPMLELYQHSCRELKKYISEGRSIVREIETDTYEENPPLFREYISATPDVKFIMDNQFKNVKTHARLLSKAMWYEWRLKLLEGLKEGMAKIADGLRADDKGLAEQENILASIIPRLSQEHGRLEDEHNVLKSSAEELANCDQDELKEARNRLAGIQDELQAKRKMVENFQNELGEKDQSLAKAADRKKVCLEEIREAERTREEFRGWSANEVAVLKGHVDNLKQRYGWSISSVSGSSITMAYRGQLQLYFNVNSFTPNDYSSIGRPKNPHNSPISLVYIADADDHHLYTLTTEKRFFLQMMRVQLQCLRQGETALKDLLSFVSRSWDKACAVVENIRLMNVCFRTEPKIVSDETLVVRSTLVLPSLATKMIIDLSLAASSTGGTISVAVKPNTRVIYGEHLNESRMEEFLASKLGDSGDAASADEGHWCQSIMDLRSRLLSRGTRS
ncbi:MAG: hypothetical protein M1819_007269 [Sarea resinae]|nr:MAG: hypothetical protein M1819_007269 [Sarea resinae]